MQQQQEAETRRELYTIEAPKSGRQVGLLGAEHMPTKLIALTGYMANFHDLEGKVLDHNLTLSAFDVNGYPTDSEGVMKLGASMGEYGLVITNAQGVLQFCRDIIADDTTDAIFHVAVWENLLITLGHEIAHLAQYQQKLKVENLPPGAPVVWTRKDHDEADLMAFNVLCNLATWLDIEPPDFDEWGWLQAPIARFYEDCAAGTKPWQAKQTTMRNEGLLYAKNRDGKLLELRSYADMLRLRSSDPKAEEWDQRPKQAEIFMVTDAEPQTNFTTLSTVEAVEELLGTKNEEPSIEEQVRAKMDEFYKAAEADIRQKMKLGEDEEVSEEQLRMYLSLQGLEPEPEKVFEHFEQQVRSEMEGSTEPDATVTQTEEGVEITLSQPAEMEEVEEPFDDMYDHTPPEVINENVESIMENDPADLGLAGGLDHSKLMQQALEERQSGAVGGQPIQGNPPMEPHEHGAQLRPIVEAVFKRLLVHIFTKCGFTKQAFTNPQAALNPVAIGDIAGADKVFVGMTTRNAANKPVKDMALLRDNQGNAWVKGSWYPKSSLPVYEFLLNPGNGNTIRRKLLVQNPQKRDKNNANAYSVNAQKMQRGHLVAYIINEDTGAFNCTIELLPGAKDFTFDWRV